MEYSIITIIIAIITKIILIIIIVTITQINNNNSKIYKINKIMIIKVDNKSLSNDNSDRSYDWSYVVLIQAFLKLAFYDYE